VSSNSKKLKILLLLDLPYDPPADQDFSELLKTPDFLDERDINRALTGLGHEVKIFGVFNDIFPLVNQLKMSPPDVVFNQFESFDSNRELEPNIIALLELFNIPYTGASPESMRLCKDKGLSKKLLSFDNIRVPKFFVSNKDKPLKNLPEDMNYPCICKPLGLEGSEGISKASLVANEKECLERIAFVHRLSADAIIEEYIQGRELYVGVYGNDEVTVLPTQEMFFKKVPDGEPKFATYNAKWDKAYRKKWGIDSGKAKKISEEIEKEIHDQCIKIFGLFKLSGYARIDFRLSNEDELVFIEANPNPGIAKNEDFPAAAKQAGTPYPELLEDILKLALSKNKKIAISAAS
jgi:D-alanine-D-alanine ligase